MQNPEELSTDELALLCASCEIGDKAGTYPEFPNDNKLLADYINTNLLSVHRDQLIDRIADVERRHRERQR